jgi:uncharacterized protein involved in cysteine biosynthesis
MDDLGEQAREWLQFLTENIVSLLRSLTAILVGLALSAVGSIIATKFLFAVADPTPLANYFGIESGTEQAFMVVGTVVIWVWKVDDPLGIKESS